jgi:hypothetical protein
MKCPRDTILRSQSSALLHQSESTADQAISARFAAHATKGGCTAKPDRMSGIFHALFWISPFACCSRDGIQPDCRRQLWRIRGCVAKPIDQADRSVPAGGAADTIARIYGEKLSEALAARRDREQGGRRHRDCG